MRGKLLHSANVGPNHKWHKYQKVRGYELGNTVGVGLFVCVCVFDKCVLGEGVFSRRFELAGFCRV